MASLGPLTDEVTIVDVDTGAAMPARRGRRTGEHHGRGQFRGYYKDADAEAERMAGGVYHCGDLAYRDEAGYAYFAGRLGDWMRVDGENLGTAPIERILLRHPDVAEAAVYAIPDPVVGDRVMAALVLARGAGFDAEEFAAFLAEQPDLGPKQWPTFIRVGTGLPRTGRSRCSNANCRRRAPTAPTRSIRSGGSVDRWATANCRPPAPLRELVETAWVVDGPGDAVRVLPDGCMDLIRMHGRVVVAGPDTTASVSARGPEPFAGLRFRPGVLPRLLGVPAAELRDQRIALDDLGTVAGGRPLAELAHELAAREPRAETAPWSLTTLRHVTSRLAAGASVARVARDVGWSTRTLQRQSQAVYGYGPATLRRVLRFRHAVSLLRDRTGAGRRRRGGRIRRPAAPAPRGARAGRHHRRRAGRRSTQRGEQIHRVPSGSSTVA